jgi:hypothetical protein
MTSATGSGSVKFRAKGKMTRRVRWSGVVGLVTGGLAGAGGAAVVGSVSPSLERFSSLYANGLVDSELDLRPGNLSFGSILRGSASLGAKSILMLCGALVLRGTIADEQLEVRQRTTCDRGNTLFGSYLSVYEIIGAARKIRFKIDPIPGYLHLLMRGRRGARKNMRPTFHTASHVQSGGFCDTERPKQTADSLATTFDPTLPAHDGQLETGHVCGRCFPLG